MRPLPLPVALGARLAPVVVLACAGWAVSTGPLAAAPADHQAAQQSDPQSAESSSPGAPSPSASASATSATYGSAPAACTSIATATIKSLVPGAKTAGKEIPSTDTAKRRTCSWNALKGYDYRWLDVSFELSDTVKQAQQAYTEHTTAKGNGAAVSGVGDQAYSATALTTDDKQQTRETVLTARVGNALVVVTYNGSDFESKKAPAEKVTQSGALKAAAQAVTALKSGTKA
ncbi:hypothetical protein [Streptomyces sp. NPDC008150]|uniref:hypothetical protein n=1 Tax=Streptomyces sp. NPDC008150 TaxID=3364816 RepID=UPI0036E2F464